MRWVNSFIVLVAIGTCQAQSEYGLSESTLPKVERRNAIGVRAYGGFMALHRRSLAILVDDHVKGFDVFYERGFSGDEPWHQAYAHPSWGLNLQYLDLGSEILGSTVRLLPYLNLPLFERPTFSLDLRIGWGFGYVERSFDRIDNYKAVAIGTRMNGAVQLAIEANQRIRNTTIGVGIAIDHQSNGSYVKPNLGINVPTVNLSVRQHFGEQRSYGQVVLDTVSDRPTNWYLRAGVGFHEANRPGGPKHTAYNLSALWVKPFTVKTEVSLGADLISKTTLPFYDPELIGKERVELMQFGLHAGIAMNFGDIALVFEPGFYLVTPSRVEGSFYHRIGVRKFFGDRWFANMLLKTHFAVADYFEWGGGIRL